MIIRIFFIVLFLLFQVQTIFCVTNDIFKTEKSGKDTLYNKGIKYFNGIETPTNHFEALKYFIAAGDLSHTDACHKAGWIFDNSSTVSQDIEKAILWYKKSSSMGLAKSMFNLGSTYQYNNKVKDYKKAWKWYRKADDKGYPAAAYQLGYLAKSGVGMRADLGLAEFYFLSSAKKGYAPAQAEMGFLYQEKVFGKNYKKAMDWYQKAAAQTNVRGIYGVGLMYDRGEGVEENDKAACKYYQKAAEMGKPHAQHALALFYEDGKGGLTKDLEKAIHFHSLAVSQDYLRAYYDLAQCYEKTGETNKSAELCYIASTQGYASAQSQLAYYYEYGYGTTQDLETAFYWYSQSVKNGNKFGLFGLGKFYEYGKLKDKNMIKAYSYYFRAAIKGQKYAAKKVGWLIMVLTGIVCFMVCLPGFLIILVYGLLTRKNFEKYKTWTIPDAILLILSMAISQIIFSGLYFAATKMYNKSIQFAVVLAVVVISNSLVFLVVIFFVRLRKSLFKLVFSFKKISLWKIIKWSLGSFVIIILFTFVYTKILLVLGIEMPEEQIIKLMPESLSCIMIIWMIITVSFVAPIVEEIVFRGILFKTCLRKWSLTPSIIFSSSIFALIHFDFYRFIPLMLMGAIMAYSFEKTRSIYVPIFIHIVNNLSAVIITILLKNLGYF